MSVTHVTVDRTGKIKSTPLGNLTSKQIDELFGGSKGKLDPKKAFDRVGWFRRCVMVRAYGVASIPWGLYRGDELIWDGLKDEPEVPFPEFDALQMLPWLIYLWEASLTLNGGAFTLPIFENGTFTELEYWDPRTVEVKKSKEGIKSLVRKVGNEVTPYEPEDVIQIYTLSPFVEQGPAGSDGAAALIHADVYEKLNRFLQNYLGRGLTKNSILFTPKATSPTDLERLKNWWKKKTRGVENAGEELILQGGDGPKRSGSGQRSGGVEVVTIGEGIKDLENVDLTAQQREDMATDLGVNHSLVMSNAANFATANVDVLNFFRFTGKQEARIIQRAANSFLKSELGYTLRFEPSRHEAFQAAELERATGLMELGGDRAKMEGVYTVDEIREILGKGPKDELEQDQEIDEGKQKDLIRWKRKIKSRGVSVPFEPTHLAPSEAGRIRARLAAGEPVEKAFSIPLA